VDGSRFEPTVQIPQLSLAAGVFPEHVPETVVHAAAATEFDAVGIWIEPDLWTPRARELLSALPTGLPLSTELRSKQLRSSWPEPVARARRVLEATRRFFENA